MTELKPCPFCGGKAVLVPLDLCHGYVSCIGDCRMQTGDFWDEPMTNAKDEREGWEYRAARAWNRRANDAVL